MAKYRKKPIVIDAVQFVNGKPGVVRAFLKEGCDSFFEIREHGGNRIVGFAIETLEGRMKAEPGDWIIRGVKGEYYPCKPDIFDATYEAC